MLTVALLCVAVAEGAVRHRSQSAHNQIVVEDKGGYRMLRFNGSMETRMWLGDTKYGHFEYTEYFQLPLLWSPNAKRVMIMGLGGGSTQRAFQNYYPTVHVDTVELDSAVAKVAKEWFGVKETNTHTIHISDGRGFVRRNKNRKYEAIMMDAYSSNTYGSFIPYHLATKEFFQLAAEDLTANGVLAYNVIGTYQEWRADIVGSMYRTMKEVFPHVYHFPAADSKNIVLVGVKAKTGGLTSATLRARVDLLRRAQPKLPAFFGPRLARIRASAPPSAAKSPVLSRAYQQVAGSGAVGAVVLNSTRRRPATNAPSTPSAIGVIVRAISCSKSLRLCKNFSTTASFSSCSKLQVLLISVPSTGSRRAARWSKSSCVRASTDSSRACSRQRTSTRRRITPVLEQGASMRMRSKGPAFLRSMPCNGLGSMQVWPRRAMFSRKRPRRASSRAMASTLPSLFIRSAMAVDLPPGAAQRSRMFSPGCGLSS